MLILLKEVKHGRLREGIVIKNVHKVLYREFLRYVKCAWTIGTISLQKIGGPIFNLKLFIFEYPPVQHLGSTQRQHLFSTQNPSVQHQKSLSSTPKSLSSTLKTPLSDTPLISTPKPPQFNTKTPSVPHRKPLSSTHPSVPHQTDRVSQPTVWNWGMCWTEGFPMWNWGILGAETEWPICLELMCWTEGVWNREDPSYFIKKQPWSMRHIFPSFHDLT